MDLEGSIKNSSQHLTKIIPLILENRSSSFPHHLIIIQVKGRISKSWWQRRRSSGSSGSSFLSYSADGDGCLVSSIESGELEYFKFTIINLTGCLDNSKIVFELAMKFHMHCNVIDLIIFVLRSSYFLNFRYFFKISVNSLYFRTFA